MKTIYFIGVLAVLQGPLFRGPGFGKSLGAELMKITQNRTISFSSHFYSVKPGERRTLNPNSEIQNPKFMTPLLQAGEPPERVLWTVATPVAPCFPS